MNSAKYDDIFICRMMMRLYSLVSPGADGAPAADRCPELWAEYKSVEPVLVRAFLNHGVRFVPVNVMSDFSGEVKTVPEPVFCCIEPAFAVPGELYSLFYGYGVEGFVPPQEPPVVRLGCMGRRYDFKTKVRMVTDGLQIGSLGKIVLDMFSLKCLSVDGVSCRLTHELLHVFGVSEEQMAEYKPAAYRALREQITPFSRGLLAANAELLPRFSAACAEIAASHGDVAALLERLANCMCLEGFPAKPSEVMTAGICLPESVSSKGAVQWRIRDVMFM